MTWHRNSFSFSKIRCHDFLSPLSLVTSDHAHESRTQLRVPKGRFPSPIGFLNRNALFVLFMQDERHKRTRGEVDTYLWTPKYSVSVPNLAFFMCTVTIRVGKGHKTDTEDALLFTSCQLGKKNRRRILMREIVIVRFFLQLLNFWFPQRPYKEYFNQFCYIFGIMLPKTKPLGVIKACYYMINIQISERNNNNRF